MFVENPQGSSDCSFDLPAVVEPTLFRVAVESSMRCAADSASVAIAFGQRGKNPLCSVPSFRLVAWKDNTNPAYDSGWKIWSDWCLGRIHDYLCNAVPVVASFLAEQSRSKAYSTKDNFNRRPPSAKYNSTWDVDVVCPILGTNKYLASIKGSGGEAGPSPCPSNPFPVVMHQYLCIHSLHSLFSLCILYSRYASFSQYYYVLNPWTSSDPWIL
uniref:Uncharacterized protein n=1 Tax=Daphnia galeata TaxID=27404 RepID=A0A8J2RYH9_9CRUS|nr:unnamed protein product [Daphnia galeata]